MTLFAPTLLAMTAKVLSGAQARKLTICTAESCTGGLLAGCLTEIAGSSAVIDRAFITYSNRAKEEMLGVPPDIMVASGAVSEPTARAMAEGALRKSGASLSIAITGIAGPGGGSAEKPVGLVHFAIARAGETRHKVEHFGEIGRTEVRLKSVETALNMLLEMLD
ncbi:MAG TPA: CinA family protein [Caulobacterales bacterium]|nr:CinA family protein [Caulobacterales bacterium]